MVQDAETLRPFLPLLVRNILPGRTTEFDFQSAVRSSSRRQTDYNTDSGSRHCAFCKLAVIAVITSVPSLQILSFSGPAFGFLQEAKHSLFRVFQGLCSFLSTEQTQ